MDNMCKSTLARPDGQMLPALPKPTTISHAKSPFSGGHKPVDIRSLLWSLCSHEFNKTAACLCEETELQGCLNTFTDTWFQAYISEVMMAAEFRGQNTPEVTLHRELRHRLIQLPAPDTAAALRVALPIFHLWHKLKATGIPIEARACKYLHTSTGGNPPDLRIGAFHNPFALDGPNSVYPLCHDIEGWFWTNRPLPTALTLHLVFSKLPPPLHAIILKLQQDLQASNADEIRHLLGSVNAWLVICPRILDHALRYIPRKKTTSEMSSEMLEKTLDALTPAKLPLFDPEEVFDCQKHLIFQELVMSEQQMFGKLDDVANTPWIAAFPETERGLQNVHNIRDTPQQLKNHQDAIDELKRQMMVVQDNRKADMIDTDSIRCAWIGQVKRLPEWREAHGKSPAAAQFQAHVNALRSQRNQQAHSSNARQDIGVVHRNPDFIAAFRYMYGVPHSLALFLSSEYLQNEAQGDTAPYRLDGDNAPLMYATMNAYGWFQGVLCDENPVIQRRFDSGFTTNDPHVIASFAVHNRDKVREIVLEENTKLVDTDPPHKAEFSFILCLAIASVESFLTRRRKHWEDRKQRRRLSSKDSLQMSPSNEWARMAELEVPKDVTSLTNLERSRCYLFTKIVHDVIWPYCLDQGKPSPSGPRTNEWDDVKKT